MRVTVVDLDSSKEDLGEVVKDLDLTKEDLGVVVMDLAGEYEDFGEAETLFSEFCDENGLFEDFILIGEFGAE